MSDPLLPPWLQPDPFATGPAEVAPFDVPPDALAQLAAAMTPPAPEPAPVSDPSQVPVDPGPVSDPSQVAEEPWQHPEFAAPSTPPAEIQFELGPENDLSAIHSVDATSGADPWQGPTPDLGEMPVDDISADVAAEAPFAQYQTRNDQLAGMSDDQLAALDPFEFEKFKARTALIEKNKVLEQQHLQAVADEQRAAANLSAMQYARKKTQERAAALDAEAEQLARAEVNPDRYLQDKSILGKIATIASVFVGGLGGSGTRNYAFEMLQNAIDADINAQRETLSERRNAIKSRRTALDDLYQQHGDEYRAAEAVRQATYAHALQQIDREAAKFDPNGTTAKVMFAGMRRDLQARMAESRQKFVDESFKRAENEMKFALMAADLEGKQLANAKARGLSFGGGTGGGAAVDGNPILSMTQEEAMAAGPKVFGVWARAKKDSLAIEKAESELGKSERAHGMAGFDGKPILEADGTVFVPIGRDEDVAEVRKRMAEARKVIRALDDVRRLYKGWSPDLVKSDHWQKVTQRYNNAKVIAKDVLGLGALSGPDEVLIDKFLGGASPTGIRDPSAGLESARESILDMVRDDLTGLGHQSAHKVIDIPYLAGEFEATESDKDRAQKSALKNADPGAGKVDPITIGTVARHFSSGGVPLGGLGKPTDTNVVLPEVRRQVEQLVVETGSDNERDAQLAAAKLDELGREGNDALRQLIFDLTAARDLSAKTRGGD